VSLSVRLAALHPKRKQSSRHPMEAIPTSPLRRGTTLLEVSPLALGILELARFRCLASRPATTTPLLALIHFILTSRMQIRPLALQRFCRTLSEETTQLSEQACLNLTIPAATTRQLERSRSLTTPPATRTRPPVLRRSLATPPASATRPPARRRSLATPP